MSGPDPTAAATWRLPRYEQALNSVLPSALAAIGMPEVGDGLALGPHRCAIVLVVDGLGWRQLQAYPELAPTMTGVPARTIDAGFPSTTVTSLASIGVGLPPGEHGVLGTSVALGDSQEPFNLLVWGFGRQDTAVSDPEAVPPTRFQPVPTVFERADAAGVTTITVLKPAFVGSGLTQAIFRGGRIAATSGLDATLAAAHAAVAPPDRRCLVYCYHPDLDAIGHLVGPHSDEWCTELARIDEGVRNLARRLPPDVLLVVTADHGMLAIPDDSLVDLADGSLMRGVRLLTGEARARHVHTRPGARDDVRDAWAEQLSGFQVVTGDEAVDAGWFGPHVTAAARPRIGDVVAVATSPTGALVHRELDAWGGRLAGMHGSLTPDELEVPLLTIHRADIG